MARNDENFIVTTLGIVNVPAVYIRNDFNDPVSVSWREWRASRFTHSQLSATHILERREFTSDNIVCLQNGDKCLWFVRFEIKCDKKRFRTNFGSRFMFQIPFVLASAMAQQFAMSDDDTFELCNALRPTPHMFDAAHFPACFYVKTLHNFTDRVFSMSFRPSPNLLPCAAPPAKPAALFDRGALKGPGAFDLFSLPRDCSGHLIARCVEELIQSPCESDFALLRTMRGVCKKFQRAVDEGAKRFLDEQHAIFEHIHISKDAAQVLEQRNFLLKCSIDSMALHRDCLNRGVHTLMRVRKFAKPGANPSKKRRATRA